MPNLIASDGFSGQQVQYSIVDGDWSNNFRLEHDCTSQPYCTARIFRRGDVDLDYETLPSSKRVSFTVRVEDNGPGTKFNLCVVDIVVVNFNEVPLLIQDKGVLSIDENSLPDSMVQGGPITAIDVDDNSLTFIIVGGSGANSFYFANSYAYKDQAGYFTTDVLLKPGVELNFESNAAALTLDIFCKDDEGLVSATKTYSISISNINDKPTLASLLSVTIPENSGEGTLLGTITYNDEDSQQTVTFMLDGQKLGDGHTAYSCWSVEANPSTVLLTPFPFQLTESGNIDIVFELSLNSGQAILALQSLSHTACNEVPNDSPKPLVSTLYEISFDWISTNVIRTQLRATTASNCGNYAGKHE